jgi:hypothetical protein
VNLCLSFGDARPPFVLCTFLETERERTSVPAALARFPCGLCRIFAMGTDAMPDCPQTLNFIFERLATPDIEV